jgi:hypothetical protein
MMGPNHTWRGYQEWRAVGWIIVGIDEYLLACGVELELGEDCQLAVAPLFYDAAKAEHFRPIMPWETAIRHYDGMVVDVQETVLYQSEQQANDAMERRLQEQ